MAQHNSQVEADDALKHLSAEHTQKTFVLTNSQEILTRLFSLPSPWTRHSTTGSRDRSVCSREKKILAATPTEMFLELWEVLEWWETKKARLNNSSPKAKVARYNMGFHGPASSGGVVRIPQTHYTMARPTACNVIRSEALAVSICRLQEQCNSLHTTR